jgi:glycosyltransferase involved in cell wall biosynthesis
MSVTITTIIPARDAAGYLQRCLKALRDSTFAPLEIIVVDDGSKDNTAEVAREFGAIVMSTGGNSMGPSFARNLAARTAQGDIIFFVDSDVCVKADTLQKIRDSFDADAELDALMGSYDNNPSEPDFISQYRNLMHSFVHQTGSERASTFWSGCGAIRRQVFLDNSGFSEGYGRPAIEDIELGYRLVQAKRKIILDRSLLVTHMKRWTFWGLIKTDIFDRGIPWTELILRDRRMPDDLNLQLSQRVSVALVFILIGLATMVAISNGGYVLVPLLVIVFLMLARWWGEIGAYRRPRRAYAVLTATMALIALLAYSQKMYGLIPLLMVTPVLLMLRHNYNERGKLRKSHRWLGIAFICFSVLVAALYLPAHHHLIFACFAVLILLGLLNSQFYIFLAGNRGMAFVLAAIPFHLLYHFYNGISFIAGVAVHLWAVSPMKKAASNVQSPSDGRP